MHRCLQQLYEQLGHGAAIEITCVEVQGEDVMDLLDPKAGAAMGRVPGAATGQVASPGATRSPIAVAAAKRKPVTLEVARSLAEALSITKVRWCAAPWRQAVEMNIVALYPRMSVMCFILTCIGLLRAARGGLPASLRDVHAAQQQPDAPGAAAPVAGLQRRHTHWVKRGSRHAHDSGLHVAPAVQCAATGHAGSIAHH